MALGVGQTLGALSSDTSYVRAPQLFGPPSSIFEAQGRAVADLGLLVLGSRFGAATTVEGGALTTEEQLTAAAGRAVNTVGPGSGPVYGTMVHSAFADEVLSLGRSDLTPEVSYLNGQVVPYGTSGSIRVDVVEGPLNAPICCYDLKTGSAFLSPGRVGQIQNNLPGGSSVPVLQITPP
jgi:hypothetical protein